METISHIFINSIKERNKNEDVTTVVKDTVFELSRKKLYRLENPNSIQKRVLELFELFYNALKENALDTTQAVEGIISGLVGAASFDEEFRLYEKIYEKERLEREIRAQKESIYQTIGATYETIESVAMNNESIKTAINDVKLRGIEMLGILKETTEEALLRTIERGSDIEETTSVITKNIVYQAIDEGDFKRARFLQIAKSVLEVAIDIADSDHAHAKSILRGSIHGTKEGITKAVEVFKNTLQFAPKESDIICEDDLSTTKKELGDIEDEFIALLHDFVAKHSGIVATIIDELLKKELDNSFAKLQRLTNEARDTITKRIEELKENASYVEKELKEKASIKMETWRENVEELEKKATQKVEELKKSTQSKKVQDDAKKLGDRAWEVAKELMKNAKDVINKK